MARSTRRRLPAQQHPDAVIRAYFGELLKIVKWCHAYVRGMPLVGILEEHATLDAQRLDRPSPPHRVNALFEQARSAFADHFPAWRMQRMLEQYAKRAADHNRFQLGKQVKAAVGIDLGSLTADRGLKKVTDEFTATNVALIQTIPEQYFGQVEQIVLLGLKDGERAKAMSAEIEDRFDVTKSRALLIARDQIGKFNGDLNKTRQKNLGVKRFQWETVNDERVRDSHAELQDGIYAWDDPPDGDDGPATPGSDIQCRCYATPIFDDV